MKFALTIAVVGVAALLAFSVIQADPLPQQAKVITVAELYRLQVIGWLGQPLGKIVTVEGVAADENYRGPRKEDAGQTLLRIQVVDGKKLPQEQVFHFNEYWVGLEIEKPKVGSKFKYIGYENGGFTGTPDKVFDYVPAHCSTGHYFDTHFLVLRDELKPKKDRSVGKLPAAAPPPNVPAPVPVPQQPKVSAPNVPAPVPVPQQPKVSAPNVPVVPN